MAFFSHNNQAPSKIANFDVIDATDTSVEAIDHLEMNYDSLKKSYLFECYYCNEFVPTNIRNDYGKHVVLSHYGKLAYPSLSGLKSNNLKPQGKSWEI